MTLTRRRWLILAACLAVGGIGLVRWWICVPSATLLRQRYDRVQLGMTEAEVEAIMSPPGDSLLDKPVYPIVDPPPPEPGVPYGRHADAATCWTTRHGIIEIDFCLGTVTQKKWNPPLDVPWSQRIREWLNDVRRLVGL
jgi:hypothetical protein